VKGNSPPSGNRLQQPKAKVDLTEEEMLAEAIAASLKETGSSAGGVLHSTIIIRAYDVCSY